MPHFTQRIHLPDVGVRFPVVGEQVEVYDHVILGRGVGRGRGPALGLRPPLWPLCGLRLPLEVRPAALSRRLRSRRVIC